MPKEICIIATTCRTGGAATIFQQFITTLRNFVEGSVLSDWSPEDFHFHLFIDPSMEQPPLPRVTYIPVDTHSWRRFYFDFQGFRQEVKRRGIVPSLIFSFTNTGVRYDAKVAQVVYFQTVLPLSPCRWNPLRKNQRTLFFYTGVYPTYVRRLLTKHTEVVLQAPFLRPAFAATFHHAMEHLHVFAPTMSLPLSANVVPYPYEAGAFHFFYPSAPYLYKGHHLLLEALAQLRQAADTAEIAERIRMHFTFSPTDRPDLQRFIRKHGLETNVVFHGVLPFETVLQLYQGAQAVVFPSEFETQGLPLLEAAAFGLPLLAPRVPYAEEVVGRYAGATFLPLASPQEWAAAMLAIAAHPQRFPAWQQSSQNQWEELLHFCLNKAHTAI